MYQNLTDEELCSLLKSNDAGAFREIYTRYWEPLSMQVLKLTQSTTDAQDILQEVFISLWQRREKLNIQSSLSAYLFTSVKYTTFRFLTTSLAQKKTVMALEALKEAWISEHSLEYSELKQHIDKAISSLPAKMQTVFLLSRHEELSHKQIASAVGIAETTVKKQVNNALKIIREKIKVISLLASVLLFTAMAIKLSNFS